MILWNPALLCWPFPQYEEIEHRPRKLLSSYARRSDSLPARGRDFVLFGFCAMFFLLELFKR